MLVGTPRYRQKPRLGARLTGRYAKDLAGRWIFNERAGRTAYDLLDKHHLTLNGDVAWSGNNLDFPGTDDYLENVNGSDFIGFSAITVRVVMKIHATTIWTGPIMNTSGGSWLDGWGMHFTSGHLTFWVESFSGNAALFFNIPTDEWLDVVGTWNGTDLRVYVNGVAGSTDTYSGAITGGGSLLVGRTVPSYEFDGEMRQLAIWKNRTLTSADARYLYSHPWADIARPSDVWFGEAAAPGGFHISAARNANTMIGGAPNA